MLEKKVRYGMVTSDLLFYEFSNYKSSLDNCFLYILQKIIEKVVNFCLHLLRFFVRMKVILK
jgi:hypothetical protein